MPHAGYKRAHRGSLSRDAAVCGAAEFGVERPEPPAAPDVEDKQASTGGKAERRYRQPYYAKNRDKVLSDQKRYYDSIKSDPEYIERRRQRMRQKYRDNEGGMRDKIHARNKTPAHRYSLYRTQAKRRSLAFNITREQFDAWFYAEACSYCGTLRPDGASLGVDRLDNSVGYEPDNCRACCAMCNYMKSTMSITEFLGKCQAVRDVFIRGPTTLAPEQREALPLTRREKYKCNTLGKYKYDAADRGFVFALDRHDFMRLIDEPCHYCQSARGGIDRVDNSVGYVLSNCVPCCGTCNRMKRASSKDAFVSQCVRIAAVCLAGQ